MFLKKIKPVYFFIVGYMFVSIEILSKIIEFPDSLLFVYCGMALIVYSIISFFIKP